MYCRNIDGVLKLKQIGNVREHLKKEQIFNEDEVRILKCFLKIFIYEFGGRWRLKWRFVPICQI